MPKNYFHFRSAGVLVPFRGPRFAYDGMTGKFANLSNRFRKPLISKDLTTGHFAVALSHFVAVARLYLAGLYHALAEIEN